MKLSKIPADVPFKLSGFFCFCEKLKFDLFEFCLVVIIESEVADSMNKNFAKNKNSKNLKKN
jgi:hypothetical protein